MLNCPYCKTPPTLHKRGVLDEKARIKYTYYYKCFRCGRKTPLTYTTIEDAKKVWNRLAEGDLFDYHYADYIESYPNSLRNYQHNTEIRY